MNKIEIVIDKITDGYFSEWFEVFAQLVIVDEVCCKNVQLYLKIHIINF